jgi:hypothetical protein
MASGRREAERGAKRSKRRVEVVTYDRDTHAIVDPFPHPKSGVIPILHRQARRDVWNNSKYVCMYPLCVSFGDVNT